MECSSSADVLRVLELFSGLGGMHCACSLSSASAGARRRFQVVAQVDINPNGNLNCRLNFPDVPQLDSNIEHIEESVFDSIRAQVWMMSPPCQPFTRAGKCRDDQDERAKPLIRLIEVLTRLKFPPEFILLENVKGFEKSNCAKMLLKQLESLNFAFEQFLLTPTQFGIPNERLRYYLIARRKSKDQPKRSYFENNENVAMAFIPGNKFFSKPFQIYDLNQDDESDFPEEYCVARSDRPPVPSDHAIKSTFQLQEILEHPDDSFLVDPKLLLKSKGYCFDLVSPYSIRSSCFTKSYGRYIRGTGSVVVTEKDFFQLDHVGKSKHSFTFHQPESLLPLRLRYFTPREIASLLGFPKDFLLSPELSKQQQYALLGNSLSVNVVAELLQYLTENTITN